MSTITGKANISQAFVRQLSSCTVAVNKPNSTFLPSVRTGEKVPSRSARCLRYEKSLVTQLLCLTNWRNLQYLASSRRRPRSTFLSVSLTRRDVTWRDATWMTPGDAVRRSARCSHITSLFARKALLDWQQATVFARSRFCRYVCNRWRVRKRVGQWNVRRWPKWHRYLAATLIFESAAALSWHRKRTTDISSVSLLRGNTLLNLQNTPRSVIRRMPVRYMGWSIFKCYWPFQSSIWPRPVGTSSFVGSGPCLC